ncbi:hypothetical protein U9M48_010160 [Paspalum notatum var. saurae]|uniref:B box-type domain-containing protein n=1 Tax=Paspalum notatum var. saurae TaxID=547442 RepID=A0AAQ3SSW6_PASNO
MKVQCDVCAAEAASVFCCADEVALCDVCDRRVHRVNKLAGKHRRFSLLNLAPPSSSLLGSAQQPQPPLCDIYLPGEEGAPVLQGGPAGDPVPGLRRVRAHGQRAPHAPHSVPTHRRAPLPEPAACPAPPPQSEDEDSSCGAGACP